ncbi:MAG: response regulator [Pseudomonadota bacterium]
MSKTLLILEDEPDIRELLAIALESSELHCELASHLSDAKSLITRLKPDFILTDIRLPDGSGLDLLSFAREHTPNTPCAVLTAYGDMESAVTALRAGAVDYLTKPVDMRALKRLLKDKLADTPAVPEPRMTAVPPTPMRIAANEDALTEDKLPLLEALEATRWNKSAAAERLGLSYRQFRYRLQKHNIQ